MSQEFFINVTESPYNADPTGANDSSAAIQNAINASPQGTILIPSGNYKLSTGITITNKTSVQIMGEGAFNGTTLRFQPNSGDVFTFSNCQHCNISLLNITYAGVAKGGNAVVLQNNCFVVGLNDVRMDYCFNGVWIKEATETRLSKVQFRFLHGNYGILFGGGVSGCFRAILDDILADNPYPRPYPNNTSSNPNGVGGWSPSTSYQLNDIATAGPRIYQCVQAGVSASSGNGPSGDGGGLRSPQNITDGTVQWRFVSKKITWIKQQSFGYSLVINKAALLNGFMGLQMKDASSPGNPPNWIFGTDIECDHNYNANVLLSGGEGVYISGSWFGSCLNGNAISMVPPFGGQFSLVNSRVSFAANHGILIGAAGTTGTPKDILIQSNFIGGNGQAQSNTYHGVVAIGEGIVITNNRIGTDVASSLKTQNSGVFMISGAQGFIIKDNDLTGNITAKVIDGSGSSNAIVKDNLPV